MCFEQILLDTIFAIFSAFLGVVIGVLWAKRQWAKDKETQSLFIRQNLIKAFQFNIDRIQQCLSYIQQSKSIIPNFRLDTVTVIHFFICWTKTIQRRLTI